MARAYKSELREAKAAETRETLLDALHDLLLEMSVEEVSIPKVAAAAGVTAPTAYRYFPTLEDLYRAFLERMRPQLGLDSQSLSGLTPEGTPDLVAKLYRRFEKHGELLRRLIDSPTWTRVRLARNVDRFAILEPAFADASVLGRKQLKVALGAIALFGSPSTWRWLRDVWGLGAADAARAAEFATRAMIRELREQGKGGSR